MLTEVKYNPNSALPYSVMKKSRAGWVPMGNFVGAIGANELAAKLSLEPDIPCLIARYENGKRIDSEAVDEVVAQENINNVEYL